MAILAESTAPAQQHDEKTPSPPVAAAPPPADEKAPAIITIRLQTEENKQPSNETKTDAPPKGKIVCKRHNPRRHGSKTEKRLYPSRPEIRRLARRGGVKRIDGFIYEETRAVLKGFVRNVIGRCATLLEYSDRKTVRDVDVCFALKQMGLKLYM